MTGTRTRSTAQRGSWDERALLPDSVGMPWWAAALCSLGLAAIGAFADMERLNRLGMVFEVCYFLGCLLAVVVVQRKGLFGPMVQPPLILALAVPGVILAAAGIALAVVAAAVPGAAAARACSAAVLRIE